MIHTLPSRGKHPAHTRRWDFPRLCVVETVYPPLHRMTPHAHEFAKISVLLAGAVEETACRETHLCVPGSVVVKPAGVVHADRFGPDGARILSVVPKPAYLREAGDLTWYRWRHGAPVDWFARVLREPDLPFEDALEECLGELWDLVGGREERAGLRPPRWLESAREALHADPASPPCVRQLAREAGVHPVHFGRTFRHYYRCTVHGYARRLRVLNAADLLASSDLPLAQVALAAGFVDQAHFCHLFKRETGTTPYAYRQRSRSGGGGIPV